tara:strand:- start:1450 stop:2337 length:888 start_codon:yes stop_codon:yes gene_type:complete
LHDETIKNCSIGDIINFRSLPEMETEDFFFLSDIPSIYEPFSINPDYYSYGFITKGSLHIQIDGQECIMTKNSLMVYRPKQIFKILNIEPHTKGVFVLFTKGFVDTLSDNIFTLKNKSFLSYGANVFFELSVDDRKILLNVFNSIFFLLKKPIGSYWETMARNLTSALIFQTEYVLRNYIDKKKIFLIKDEMTLRLFKNLIMQYFKKERNLSFYSDKLNISQNQLGITIKRVSGTSPRKMIDALLVTEAKRLLKSSNDTVGMIAYALNFSDIYTFSKFFKRNTGYSPSQYRSLSG